MNPLIMWLRGHPAERLAIAIICLVAVGIGWQGWAHRGSQAASPQPTTTPAASSVAPSRPPTPVFGSTPDPQLLQQATDVTRQFLVALETYRYDDQPSAQGQRVHPFVSERLYSASFTQPSNNRTKQAGLHEVDTPAVTRLTPEGYSATGQLGILARVSVQRKTDQDTRTEEHPYELFLIQQGNGWKVDDFTAGAGG